ncbi:MAG: methylamine dehydrogenase accessory protein MauD, partial [Acidobacteria bacterium]|nr:methylamine dehydrogenase accessory protein MauD [Acidobacteriota bacterium]MDW7985469.1 methylamine dehydrogenase accessory protein MauD [Acidobacteriota bacterium]
MSGVWLASYILLWSLVVLLALTVLALARQIGVLHERIAPLGALATAHGPQVGDPSPVFDLRDLGGRPLRIGGERPDGRGLYLVFISPECPVCKKILPSLKVLARNERQRFEFVLISDGQERDHMDFIREMGLQEFPYVLSADVGMAYRIGRLPYAVLLDDKGVVRAKGLVNTMEHLES